MYAQNMEPLQVHDLHVVIVSLPSALGEALNRGSILTKYVCTYVRGGSHSGMSHGMSLHTIDIGRPYAGICASHSMTHSDTFDSDIDRRQQYSLTMQQGHHGLDTMNTEHSSYSNSNTYHTRLTCTRLHI